MPAADGRTGASRTRTRAALPQPRPNLTQRASIRVLVADDSPVNRLVACAILSQWGIAPKIARSGAEAAQLAGEEDFDLILMDLDMPGMDGYAATRRIREFERTRPLRPAVPVLAYTDGATPVADTLLRESGLNGVLKKPCDSLAMSECLAQWCADAFEG